ncbi:GNAT family N-acetyltransferase [Paenibacillus silvisoli]|uniref:GNAT family N-acetyltransferase n=1 Tax=Paenibacillus silvisoli TaxID=3110539 RepID=UPI0028052B79|nr:GNAT family N-acetyltransferase [Paenibacillus silvisoli]
MKTNYPMLETERLYLRELTLDDADAVYLHFSHPEVTRFMDIEACRNRKEAEEIIAFHVADSGCRYGIFSKAANELIGTCGYHCWSTEQGVSKAEIGFDLSPSYWGKGYMQEAIRPLLQVGFGLMKLDMIEATCDPGNVPSQRLLTRMGFVHVGVTADNLLIVQISVKEMCALTSSFAVIFS